MARMSKIQKEMFDSLSPEEEAVDVEPASLHKVEEFNGEFVPPTRSEDEEGSIGFRLSYEEKLQSMLNAVKILPPNLIKDGRHTLENVQAINCFKVTEEMMDEVYKNFKHEPWSY